MGLWPERRSVVVFSRVRVGTGADTTLRDTSVPERGPLPGVERVPFLSIS